MAYGWPTSSHPNTLSSLHLGEERISDERQTVPTTCILVFLLAKENSYFVIFIRVTLNKRLLNHTKKI
jgi:hypothetical protein